MNLIPYYIAMSLIPFKICVRYVPNSVVSSISMWLSYLYPNFWSTSSLMSILGLPKMMPASLARSSTS